MELPAGPTLCFHARTETGGGTSAGWPVWGSAPPPYIASKPLVPLERQSARETALQHSPQHGARSGRVRPIEPVWRIGSATGDLSRVLARIEPAKHLAARLEH